MDNSWVDIWRAKARKTRFIFIMSPILFLLVLFILVGEELETMLPLLTVLIFLELVICVMSMQIRVKIRIIDTYTICVYSGVITNILIIEGIEYDSCTLHNDYLYGQLPDGRQVNVKQSIWTGEIKITVGKDNDINVML